MPTGDALGPGWIAKVNVRLDWNSQDKAAIVSIDSTDFNFGWFQRKFPQGDYSRFAGIYGRFRVPVGQQGSRISGMFVIPRGGKSEYYTAELGTCSESRGDWVEFFVPFERFLPGQNATEKKLRPQIIQTGGALEISITTMQATTRLEFADLRFINAESEKSLLSRITRARLGRQLKPESELATNKRPKLLLFGKRLDRIRAKATEGGIQQAGYERLIQAANQALKQINPDNPFANVFAFANSDSFNAHVNRGRFEGTINPLVIPLETLAAAAVIIGDDKYGKPAAKALVNMARTLDVNSPEIEQGFFYTRTFYVRALAFGYDWLYDYMTPEERRDVKITLLGFIEQIYNRSWTDDWGRHPLNRVWNWDPGLVSCAGLGLLALEDETEMAESAMLVQFRRHLRDYLTFGIDFDGCGHEGPAYLSYGLGAGVQFAEALRDKGYGDLFADTNWRLIAPWLAAEALPNRPVWNNLSDCSFGQIAPCPVYMYTCGRLAELAKTDPVQPGERLSAQNPTCSGLKYVQHFSERPGDKRLSYGAMAELMGWSWNRSTDAQNPAAFSDASILAFVLFYEACPVAADPAVYLPDSQFFRGRGLVVSRWGGYGKEGFHLAVEAGPHAAGHDQADKGTFTLRAYGEDLAIDSGYGNDGEPEKSGTSFAHNVVLIDGKGQPCRWHNNSDGEITGFKTDDSFDWIRACAKGAWNYSYFNWKKNPTGINVEKADRHYVFIKPTKSQPTNNQPTNSQLTDKQSRDKQSSNNQSMGNQTIPPYLVIFDDFRMADGLEHDFTWQWHIQSEFVFDIQKSFWTARQDRIGYNVLTTDANRPVGKATFTLRAPKAGKYNIIGMTRCGGSDLGKSDSFILSVNGGPRRAWHLVASPSFTWSVFNDDQTHEEIALDLAGGETVVCELSAREPEAQLAYLALNESGAKLPEFPAADEKRPSPSMLPASAAIQDKSSPLRLKNSLTRKTDVNMIVFPVLTSNGQTSVVQYQTSKEGAHPKLMHTVRAVEPKFLMLALPRQDENAPIPTVKSFDKEGKVGLQLQWPDGGTDSIVFQNGENGLVPTFKRTR